MQITISKLSLSALFD
uniref:Uncharacterized protein n=1 Tax=Arundo donax TaxID=35708 RepID=A0A0A9B8S0_ARUDO